MSQNSPPPRVGFLGAGPDELELLLELRATGTVDVLGVYDSDARAPGLAVAAAAGVPNGADPEALQRLQFADAIVLPRNRRALQDAVQWASGLRAELVGLTEARLRWGGGPQVLGPANTAEYAAASDTLRQAVDTSARLEDRRELADWLLEIAMRTVGANGGSVQLLAADSDELYLVAGRGLSERLVRHGRHRVGEGVSGLVAATLAPQLLHGPKSGRLGRERGDVAAAMSLPLEDAGELLGVLNLSSTHPGRRFGPAHLQRIERLAPRMARLLRQAARFEPRAPALELPRLLQRLEVEGLEPPARLAALGEQVRIALGAEAAMLYVATPEGDWIPLLPAGGRAPIAIRRNALEKAFLEGQWVYADDMPVELSPGADPLAAAVDRALTPQAGSGARVCAPLLGVDPIGVVVLEFSSLETADRAQRDGMFVVEQLALGCDALLREHRQRARLDAWAALARGVHGLHEHTGQESADLELASLAARLVSGRRAFVRRVDEAHRTYWRPATHGVEAAALAAWREVDARVSERTLRQRHAILTTAADEPEDAAPPARSSFVSVPFLHQGRIVAVLNVYEKEPQGLLDSRTFTSFDRDLLEGLGMVMARWFDVAAPLPPRQPQRAITPPPAARVLLPTHPASAPAADDVHDPFDPAPAPTPVPPRDPSGTSHSTLTAPTAPATQAAPATTPLALLHELVHAAAEEQRSIGIWLLRFDGLSRLGEAGESARRSLAAAVQRGLRGGDRVAWVGEQDLAVFGFEPPPASVGFEARLASLARPLLARWSRPLEGGIELRIGASTFPQDGADPTRLLVAAAERAR